MNVEVNYLAVLLAGVSSMVVGGLWYSPVLFGKVWNTVSKRDHAREKQEAPLVIGLTFVCSLLMAFVLAHVSFLAHSFYKGSWLGDAITTAFWLWLGIGLTAIVTGGLFEQRRKKAMALQLGNMLVTLLVMAAIIGWLHP